MAASGGAMTRGEAPSLATPAQIFGDRASFELHDEDVTTLRRQFDAVASLQNAPRPRDTEEDAEQQAEFLKWQAKHPFILDCFEQFEAHAKGKRVTLFLDYDGTLAPIVKDPDKAYMSAKMRAAVRQVARVVPTAIISGRGREKVTGFVGLRELFYAGSHGLDIVGPQINGKQGLAFQPAADFAPIMDRVYLILVAKSKDIPGSYVEHNKFCVSVHFRNCPPGSWQQVADLVDDVLSQHPNLHHTRGRKVLEIRPKVDWDKGCALTHLLGALGLADGQGVLSLYIGDDRTDEDAFTALQSRPHGFGILVSCKAKATKAAFTLRDPEDVRTFLERVVAWGRGPHNGWAQSGGCVGWSYDSTPLPTTPTSPMPARSNNLLSEEAFERAYDEAAQEASDAGSPLAGPHDSSRQQATEAHARDAATSARDSSEGDDPGAAMHSQHQGPPAHAQNKDKRKSDLAQDALHKLTGPQKRDSFREPAFLATPKSLLP
ncbi:hypothetical protein WJX73_008765 [Symbiochloris irregularis]|uniref:Trehalose 6-phosphate phosphatase n=1 Tax=Symbiochloris irregularis TaxID=706552 RepID=A0AAW1NP34_9CHLO